MSASLELFDPAEVEVPAGPATVSLKGARSLLVAVEGLRDVDDEDFCDACLRVMTRAERMGAHSVLRGLGWLLLPETISRFDFWQHAVPRVVEIAERWARKVEASHA